EKLLKRRLVAYIARLQPDALLRAGLGRVAADCHHLGAQGRELARRRQPDSRCSAEDDGLLAFHVHSSLLLLSRARGLTTDPLPAAGKPSTRPATASSFANRPGSRRSGAVSTACSSARSQPT